MINLKKITGHAFIENLLKDSMFITKGRDFKITDIEFPNDPKFSEFEYYIHTTGFYCIHLLKLCDQLDKAIELLSNYRYNKTTTEINRIDHLTYNIENYIIRLSSLSER